MPQTDIPTGRLVAVTLDPVSLPAASDAVARERDVAIADLIEDNRFFVPARPAPEYRLRLGLADHRLTFDVRDQADVSVLLHKIAMASFRRILKDYFLLCDHYYAALRTATPEQIETIDFGRRAVHDDAARLLLDRLNGAIEIDIETGRRFFTLLAALQPPA